MIIHINGWPGVGKKTVGALVAAAMRARFVDNHLLHDVAIRCTGLGDPDRWPLYETVRRAAYAALARRPAGETIVMTNGLCVGSPREVAAWAHVVDLAATRGALLVPVVLEAEPDEILRRVQSPDRRGRKLTDAVALAAMMAEDRLQMPEGPEGLVLDVTHLTAEQAAATIVTWCRARAAAL